MKEASSVTNPAKRLPNYRFPQELSELPFTQHYLTNGAEFHLLNHYKMNSELKTDGMQTSISAKSDDGFAILEITFPSTAWTYVEFWALLFVDEFHREKSSTESPWRTTTGNIPTTEQPTTERCECPAPPLAVPPAQTSVATPTLRPLQNTTRYTVVSSCDYPILANQCFVTIETAAI